MKHFINISSFEDLKKQYRKLALANHPDKGGKTEIMQEINVEFDVLFNIWKDRVNENHEQPTSETASEYRRNFYTANGWEGSRYDCKLSTKDIAAKIRDYAKMKWPQYKFSVRVERYTTVYLKLVSGPEPAFKEGFNRGYISTCQNVRGYEKDLTEIVFNVMSDVCEFMNSYNYDDSDGMIDYFDTNFYTRVCVGDFDKPYQIVATKKARVESSKEPEQKDNTTTPGLENVDYSDKAVAVFGDTRTIKDDIAIRFVNGVLKQKTVLSKNITLRDVEIIPEPDFNSGMILKAISPIFITKSDLHLRPNDQYYNEAISINLSSKKTVLLGERRDLNELSIIPIGHIKEKCITIREGKEGECKNKCFTYTFKVEGDPTLIEIGYKCGFGKGNAMGFGCVEEVK